MKSTRRSFLIESALGISALIASPKFGWTSSKESEIYLGLQLYSVRDKMMKEPLSTLKKLSAIGYKNIEHANYIDRKFYGYSPQNFLEILNDVGLKMRSGHCVLLEKHWDKKKNDFTDEWKQTLEDATIVGQKYIVSPSLQPSLRTDYDGLLRFLEVFNKCGELCKRYGLRFGYHNHDFEFRDYLKGKILYSIILDNTDPELVVHQMDIGNMYAPGGRAMDILKKYPNRFESMHVKDLVKVSDGEGNEEKFVGAILGWGLIPVREIIDQFRQFGGTKEFIIEHSSYQYKTPMECVESDLRVMEGWGY